MNRFLNLLYMIIISSLLISLTACESDDDDDDSTPQEVELTQALLNSSVNLISADLTGGNMAHNGNPNQTGDDTYRDVHTAMTDASAAAQPGDIITKLTYGKDSQTGEKSARPQVAFAMIKQEEGFNSGDNLGDWTWYMIPIGDTDDLSANPNGLASGANKIDDPSACASCHSGGSSDYRFVFPQ